MLKIILSIASIVIFLMMLTSTALAGDWETTFSEDSLPDELTNASVVVAAGGPEADEIGQTLVDSLDEAGAPVAMTNPVFDGLGERSDQDVVADLAHLPVDVIVVLRTFGSEPPEPAEATTGDTAPVENEDPEADDDESEDSPASDVDGDTDSDVDDDPPVDENLPPAADSGMLTVYAIDGSAIAGFMVYPGQRLTREQRRNVGRGISREAMEATRDAAEGRPAEEEDSEQQREDTLAREDQRYRLVGRGRSMQLRDTWEDEYYEGAQIYVQLGEEHLRKSFEDAADRRDKRRRSAAMFGVLGLIALTAGGGTAIYARTRPVSDDHPQMQACEGRQYPPNRWGCRTRAYWDIQGSTYRTAFYAGIGASVIGTLIFSVGSLSLSAAHRINPHPLTKSRLTRRVHQTNIREAEDAEEAEETGEEEGEQALRSAPGRSASLRMTPYFSPYNDGVEGGVQFRIDW